ncbi:hypothetical protein ACF09H_31865 [Streptomyces sp. NPDC014983]|uniref:hypothetical protein n=1 Tax=Streptomyces sp. NPDC014983 TaxID=3364933 RepID=UPI0036F5619C
MTEHEEGTELSAAALHPGRDSRARTAARCDSHAYTRRRGGCGAPVARLATITSAERRARRYRLCDQHAVGLPEDVAGSLPAFRCTGVAEAALGAVLGGRLPADGLRSNHTPN